MTTQTKRQAKYHGEIGANGKAYAKGQFIAEQPEYQGKGSKAKKGTGKQEVKPYVWQVAPAGFTSIYHRIAFYCKVGQGYTLNTAELHAYPVSLDVLNSYIAMHKQGWVWIAENAPYAPLINPSDDYLLLK